MHRAFFMAADYRIFPDQRKAQRISQQRRPMATPGPPTGRPSSVVNHSRSLSDSSKSNMGGPPRSKSTMHYFPEQFYIDQNFDIDKALEHWGLWDSETKLQGRPNEQHSPPLRTPLSLCTNRKPPNPSLTRAADLTEFIFNPDCPECCDTVWPTPQIPTKSPSGFSLHKSQNSWSTVSTDNTPNLTPINSHSSSSLALGSQRLPTMYDHTVPGGGHSPPPRLPEDLPELSCRLSRPPSLLLSDEYFVFPQLSSPDTPILCPECSAAPISDTIRQPESPSRPQPHRDPTQNSVSSVHKPRVSADSLLQQSTSRTNSASEDRHSRFRPSRPAPKPTVSRSASDTPARRENTTTSTSDSTPQTSSSDMPLDECSRERSVWESDSDSEDDSKFGIGSLKKVRSKMTLRRVNRSSSRLSMTATDAVPPLPTNLTHSFSKKNASTGSIHPVGEAARRRAPTTRSPSLMPGSRIGQMSEKTVDSTTPTPAIKPPSKSPEIITTELKCSAHEASKLATAGFYSCAQTQTDMNLILPDQKGFKQAWWAIRSRMKVLACSKVRNATGHLNVSGKSEKN